MIESTAAYISVWLRVFNTDNKLVITADSRTQKAAEWIHGAKPEEMLSADGGMRG